MAKKKPQIPAELTAYIKRDETTFHCDDGDWDLNIQSRDDSDFKEELPLRAIMIAENGCGDCLYLNVLPGGKFAPKVFVYWHEEERGEMFAKSIKELIATSDKTKAEAKKAKPSKTAAASKSKVDLKKFEKDIASKDAGTRLDAWRAFRDSDFGLDALPPLRRILASHDPTAAINAAECIARLGPEAATCPAGEEELPIAAPIDDEGDLFEQLTLRGAHVWGYSGYANCYSACLDALVKLGYEPDDLIEYVQAHIGLDLFDALQALKSIGTPEARDMAKRAFAFWAPDLNMSETKKAKALVESIGAKKKK